MVSRENEIIALNVGGSIGAKKGNFYERHFQHLLQQLGYEIVKAKDFNPEKFTKTTCVHKYRTSPDQFTEIDFFIPSARIGFWVTNLGQITRYRKRNGSDSFNEFLELRGICPHCKIVKLPNKSTDILNIWTCSKCKRLVSPFDLLNKTSFDGHEVIEYENRSASLQAHKQAYYRIGEYIETKTSDDDISCIEIIYNKRKEWRNWHNAIDLFFDGTIFVFDDIKHIIGSDKFESELNKIILNSIRNPPKPKSLLSPILEKMSEVRKAKMKNYSSWIRTIRNDRKSLWSNDEPVSFPIRYSIYGILKSRGMDKRIDPYIYAVLIKAKNSRLDTSSRKESIAIKKAISNGLLTRDGKITAAGIGLLEKYKKYYRDLIEYLERNEIKYSNPKDYWFSKRKKLVIEILKNLYTQSIKNNWYKMMMAAACDYRELNSTPFINEQFEPLETLTYIVLDKFKKEGIIKSYDGEPGRDIYNKTWLSFMPFANEGGFELGTDASVILANGKQVHIQCKSNTAFRKWERNQTLIKNSGIPYKDSKRMIAHNVLFSFNLKNKKLIWDDQRTYVAIIDGNWNSNKGDIYRIIRLMYLLGVDDIFFADEIETKFRQFLIEKGKE